MFHDHKTAGHPEELETYSAVQQQFWWPGLGTFVKNYVKECRILTIQERPKPISSILQTD